MKIFRTSIFFLIVLALSSCNQQKTERTLPEVDHKDLSNLHGFNLLEKFASDWFCGPYREQDFKMIADYGFNFVRLPMDYRCITEEGKWDLLKEDAMKDVDQAIEWGEKYGIHVCINLHHAPGYCINAREFYSKDSSLWTGESARDAFVALWAQMARRYKDISNDNVSFNLLNEPARTSKENYVEVAIRAIEAIRDEDPERMIMSDGWNVGKEPIVELVPYDVVQMFRGYWPMNLTHYGASWIDNTYGPMPEWPSNQYLGQYIKGPDGKAFELHHSFEEDTPAELEVLRVSGSPVLKVMAGDMNILEKEFNPETDETLESFYNEENESYEGVYLKSFKFTVPEGTEKLSIKLEGGNWITYGKVTVYPQGDDPDTIDIIPGNIWGGEPVPVEIKEDGFVAVAHPDADWDSIYRADHLDPWIDFKNKHDIGIMVGEWGVYHKAPHDITLEWMNDMLDAWEEHNLGWAMWNFRGSFGVADSDRPGAEYEEINGVEVDTAMMRILREAVVK